MKYVADENGSLHLKLGMMLCFVILMMSPLFTEIALANNDLMIVNVLCNAQNQLTGPIGKAIAILIVISLAIALFIGKVSWGVAIAVGVGMGVLFGAPGIVNLLSGGNTNICL